MKTKRNGEIDLLRFLCAAGIVVHHINELYPSGLMVHGYTFVKFFFMVSGFFMVSSAEKLGDLSRDPSATKQSLQLGKQLLRRYSREKGRTLPSKGLLFKLTVMYLTPVSLLLKQKEPMPEPAAKPLFP